MLYNIPSVSSEKWKGPVGSSSELPNIAAPGDMRVTLDTFELYVYNGTSWQLVGGAASGVTSLNGLTSGTQTFATGTSGSDFNISSSGSTHTFNIPDASDTARGLVTTGSQTFAGDKTFDGDVTFNGNVTGFNSFHVDRFTLDAGQITVKEVTLSFAPTDPTKTVLLVAYAGNQDYGVSFTVTGSTLSWSGLDLDGILESGDEITILYN